MSKTIREANVAKKELELKILNLLLSYEEECDVFIDDIEYEVERVEYEFDNGELISLGNIVSLNLTVTLQ